MQHQPGHMSSSDSCLFPPMVDQGWAACHNCLAHLWSPPLEMEEFWQLSVELFQPSPSFSFIFKEKKREKVRHGCPTQFLDWQPCLLLQRCAIIDHTFERRRQTIRSRARNSLWSNPPSGVSSLLKEKERRILSTYPHMKGKKTTFIWRGAWGWSFSRSWPTGTTLDWNFTRGSHNCMRHLLESHACWWLLSFLSSRARRAGSTH